jgi:protein TonB
VADAITGGRRLGPWTRYGLLAAVIFFHVGGGWALTQIRTEPIIAGEGTPLEVAFIQEMPPQPQVTPETAPPQEPQPEPPQLESMIQPPPPDLPAPSFPVPPPPPPKPVAKPQPKPQPQPQPQQAAPAPAAPQNSGPRTVYASQVAYLNPPRPIYPVRSRRSGEAGTVMVRVLIDATGNPEQAGVQHSSGHAALDESAVSAVKAARFRPYTEGGVPQPVWVLVPINFVMQ